MTQVIEGRMGEVALLRLDRPAALNALNAYTVAGLNAALDRIEGDDSIALVITGTGRAFSAGQDLKEKLSDPMARVAEMHRLVLRLAAFPKVSVAAINGLAYGGGLELAMACTLRTAAPNVPLGLPESKALKAMPGYGGTQLLCRLVGRAKALEMLLTGDPVSAEEARAIGLVNVVAEDCVAAAVDLATRASVAGPSTQTLIRRAVSEGLKLEFAKGLALEARLVRQIAENARTRATVAEFAGKGG